MARRKGDYKKDMEAKGLRPVERIPQPDPVQSPDTRGGLGMQLGTTTQENPGSPQKKNKGKGSGSDKAGKEIKARRNAARRRRLILTAGYEHFSSVVFQPLWTGADGDTTSPDISNSAHTIGFGQNAQIDTDVLDPFGNPSVLFDGTDDVLFVSDSDDWTFTGDFTVEAWIRPAALGTMAIMSQYNSSGTLNYGWAFRMATTNMRMELSDDGSTAGYVQQTVADNPLTIGNWHHVAHCRFGDNVLTFIDGVSSGGSNPPTGVDFPAVNSTMPFRIGGTWSDTAPIWEFNGNIGQCRIINGVGIYQADFTPPNAPFPTS